MVSVGPSKIVAAKTHNSTILSCNAEGNPPPRFQWLQKLPSHEVLVRGHTRQLYIENVTYDDQGEYVCKAINELGEDITKSKLMCKELPAIQLENQVRC